MPFEDYTTFTKVTNDPADPVSIDSSTVISYSGLDRDYKEYVYKDYGAGAFGGSNFTHLVDAIWTNATHASTVSVWWMIANTLDDAGALDDMIGVEYVGNSTVVLFEDNSGSFTTDSGTATEDVRYYYEIELDTGVGAFGTMYLRQYSDVSRLTLVDTMSVTLTQAISARYLYALSGWDIATSSRNISGDVRNLDLQIVDDSSSSSSGSSASSSSNSSSSSSSSTASSSSDSSSSSPGLSSSSSGSSASSASSSSSSSSTASSSSISSSGSSSSSSDSTGDMGFSSSSSSSSQGTSGEESISNEDEIIREHGEAMVLERRTYTTVRGQRNYAWGSGENIYGWAQHYASQRTIEREGRKIEINQKVFTATNPSITEGDRLTFGGNSYIIHAVVDQAGKGRLWRLDITDDR